MPLLCGPLNSRFTFTGNPCPHLDLAIQCDSKTLGEALKFYEQHFKAVIRPLQEPLDGKEENCGKYFSFCESSTPDVWQAVDVHVFRNGAELCPKQDLSFHLENTDVVEIGELIC